MKSVIKYISIVFVAGALLNSCETTDLDLRVSPNALADDQADPAIGAAEHSMLRRKTWTPLLPSARPDVFTMPDLLRFAGLV